MNFSTKSKLISLLINISIGILGFWLILNPAAGVSIFRFYTGIILLIAAISLFIVYRRSEEPDTMKLIQSIVFAILGIVFLVSMTVTQIFLGIVLLVWVIVEAFMNIRLAIIYSRLKFEYWWLILLYGLGILGLGIYILFNLSVSGKALVMLVGVFILVRSIFEVINTLLYKERYYKAIIVKKDDK